MPNVIINNNGAKSIALTGGSLIVKVDVVPANWYNSNKYAETGNEIYRGIQVYDKKKKQRILNYPFWFNDLLRQKDSHTAGVFKQAIRLLKNIKADAERLSNSKINLSSYAISSLLYSVADSAYHIGNRPLTLLKTVNDILARYSNELIFDNAKDPLGQPLNSSESVIGVRTLQSVCQLILNDISNELNKVINIA